jgi:hypothetical protein
MYTLETGSIAFGVGESPHPIPLLAGAGATDRYCFVVTSGFSRSLPVFLCSYSLSSPLSVELLGQRRQRGYVDWRTRSNEYTYLLYRQLFASLKNFELST